jgi:hypothetical protein
MILYQKELSSQQFCQETNNIAKSIPSSADGMEWMKDL